MKISTLLSLLYLLPLHLLCQTYEKGYAVSVTGDTLKGDIISYHNDDDRLKVELKKNGVVYKIKPKEFTAYGMEGDRMYRLVGKRFIRIKINGEVSLLRDNREVEKVYYLQKGKDLASIQRIYKGGFLEKVYEFMGDDKELMYEIKEKNYGPADLVDIVQKYNNRKKK